MTRLVILMSLCVGLVVAVCTHRQSTPVTVYLPDAKQGSQPLCIANQTGEDIGISHGPVLRSGQAVTASVVTDFNWEFSSPATTTKRQDVDCIVVAR